MKRLIFTIFLFSQCVIAEVVYSWWLTVDFPATEIDIEGIPVNSIDPSWRLITVLTRGSIPKEALASDSRDSMTELNYRFTIEKDINGDGIIEKVITGVFEDDNSKVGRFVLILSMINGAWTKIFLEKDYEMSGFSILNEKSDGTIFWTFCMECGMEGYIRWDGQQYSIEWRNEEYG